MAKKKATDEVVFAVCCENLVAQGIEPGPVMVQQLTQGSHTTVGESMKRWEKKRSFELAQEKPPQDLSVKGEQFVRAIWNQAKQHADVALEEARIACRSQLQAAKAELTHAVSEIIRLESENEALSRQLVDGTAALEHERAQAKAQNQRSERAEVNLGCHAQALERAREETQLQLVRAAALEGECAALKQQVSELQATRRSKDPSARIAKSRRA